MRLLLVEDTRDVAEAIVASFGRRGDAVDHVTTIAEAEDSIAVQDYDVAILDIALPDGEGTEVLRQLRAARKSTPVLVLTARSEVDERVAALDGGADDYLVKPFDLRELQARVRALARRATPERAGIIRFGDLVFDPAGRAVNVDGAPVALTRREFSLLEVMLANRGRVISKERIFDRMFSFNEEDVGLNTIEIYVARLRRKLEGSRVSIRTLRGLGYQLVADG
ncbi:MAG TPA: response regulator transcription factor [Paracoccaceae bacterium]|nr:response regulator transcription factor [Paracoccaceae bacterium]